MKRNLLLSAAVVAMASLLTLSGCGQKKNVSLSGAGATFPAPFYGIVTKEFAKVNGTRVSYGPTGSGSGIRSVKDFTVDFGGTDVFLSDQEMSEMPAEVIHIPTCIGAVVMAYNLADVKELRLTPELITQIYTGKITKWDDAKIKEVNPGVNLPGQDITVVYRSDGSGTTAVFSGYMCKVSPDWNSALGQGKSLNFPTGVSAKGNPGVAGVIAETPGALGFIGSEYALALNIPSALMQNQAGNFVAANMETISASASSDLPADTRGYIYDSSDPTAYPISTMTWLLVYKEQSYNKRSKEQAVALKEFLKYVIGEDGSSIAQRTHFAPLPAGAKEKAMQQIESMTYDGKAI